MKFAVIKNYLLFEKKLICGDVKIFARSMQEFLKKEFVDPQDMFVRVCYQYPFEFLLLCDLYRETYNMFAKFLMCKCYMKKYHVEKQEYVEKFIHFHCKCKEKHLLLVCFCDNHPYSSDMEDHIEKECTCSSVLPKDFCDFWGWISYLLNFKVYNVCVKRVPESLKDNIINTYQYYKNLRCEPFFSFDNNTNSFKFF